MLLTGDIVLVLKIAPDGPRSYFAYYSGRYGRVHRVRDDGYVLARGVSLSRPQRPRRFRRSELRMVRPGEGERCLELQKIGDRLAR